MSSPKLLSGATAAAQKRAVSEIDIPHEDAPSFDISEGAPDAS